MSKDLKTLEDTAIARPLTTLAPLIRAELQAGDAAGIEHYRRAGELLLEAKAQCEHGEWTAWVERNFHLSIRTARDYMALTGKSQKGAAVPFSSLRQATRPNATTHYPAPPPWHTPVQRLVERVNLKAYAEDAKNRRDEQLLVVKLAEQIIDIGFKVLAAKLHPDKGGSTEGMARLNRAKALLKGAI